MNNISSALKYSHQVYRSGDLKSLLPDDEMLPTNYNTASKP
jgi:hypothetical protein